MAYGPATTRDAATERLLSCYETTPFGDAPAFDAPAFDAPAFDAADFDELIDMIGEDGVMEMVAIFETETRLRLRRMMAGDQTIAAQLREMHTLKGAAGSVGAPRLTALGRALEHAAHQGIAPTTGDLMAIEAALEAYLAALRARNAQLAPAD
jgi:HPt (histidine-containing phosphotransfer) domain-containing protein